MLGDPVAHSLSPLIQNAAFRAAGVDGVYVALRCRPGDVPGIVAGLARADGGGNVTLPHKGLAAATVERPSEAVVRTGACNTFWGEGGLIHGDNTDVDGFGRTVDALFPGGIRGARVLVLGAGGAARAVVHALLAREATVALLNRTPGRARELAEGARGPVRVMSSTRAVKGTALDLVVNATSLGLREGDPLPMDLDGPASVGRVLDVVYGPEGGTPFTEAARARGIPATDGREMLVRQGAAAFERWWGRPAPLEAMRSALPNPG